MNCPICQRSTTRMIYRRTGKLCPDCANPDFIRRIDLVAPPDLGPMAEYLIWLTVADSPASSRRPSPPQRARSAVEAEAIAAAVGISLHRAPSAAE